MTVIQVRSVNKTEAGTIEARFDPVFPEPPIVLVSPHWKTPHSVQHVPTISHVTEEGCLITSENHAPDYFVNVLAITKGAFELESIWGSSRKGIAGSKAKNAEQFEIDLMAGGMSHPDPPILLSSFWARDPAAEAQWVETIDDLAASECTVISKGKAATDYCVNYLAMDLGIGKTDDGKTVCSGIANKTGKGLLRVYFQQVFDVAPTVFVSPWWNDANSGVGYIESVTKVERHYFEVYSRNAATNFFVTWFAIGT